MACNFHKQPLVLFCSFNAESEYLQRKSSQFVFCSAAELIFFQFYLYEIFSWEDREDQREGRRKERLSDASDFLLQNKSKLLFKVFKALQHQAWLPVLVIIPQMHHWSHKVSVLAAVEKTMPPLTQSLPPTISHTLKLIYSPCFSLSLTWLNQNSLAFLFSKHVGILL